MKTENDVLALFLEAIANELLEQRGCDERVKVTVTDRDEDTLPA